MSNENKLDNKSEISGKTSGLAEHPAKATYKLLTTSDISDIHYNDNATELDFQELQATFKSFCPDYMETLDFEAKSLAVEFCSKIIYEVGPKSRSVKKESIDKCWRFPFPSDSQGKISKVVYVVTNKNNIAPTKKPNVLVLTVKEAGLLAMDTFDKLVRLAGNLPTPKYLLTPLSGAIFSRSVLSSIAEDLSKSLNKTFTEIDVLILINNSCQTNGHHLDNSNSAVALVAASIATRNIKDERVKSSIISKIRRQYIKKNKIFSDEYFDIFAKYANAGFPAELDPKSLIARFNDIQISVRQAALAASQTQLNAFLETLSREQDNDAKTLEEHNNEKQRPKGLEDNASEITDLKTLQDQQKDQTNKNKDSKSKTEDKSGNEDDDKPGGSAKADLKKCGSSKKP